MRVNINSYFGFQVLFFISNISKQENKEPKKPPIKEPLDDKINVCGLFTKSE